MLKVDHQNQYVLGNLQRDLEEYRMVLELAEPVVEVAAQRDQPTEHHCIDHRCYRTRQKEERRSDYKTVDQSNEMELRQHVDEQELEDPPQ